MTQSPSPRASIVPWLDLVTAARRTASGVALYQSGAALRLAVQRCAVAPQGLDVAGQAYARALIGLASLARAWLDAPPDARIALKAAIGCAVDALDHWPSTAKRVGHASRQAARQDAAAPAPATASSVVVNAWWIK